MSDPHTRAWAHLVREARESGAGLSDAVDYADALVGSLRGRALALRYAVTDLRDALEADAAGLLARFRAWLRR
jgi:hypothetical protein